MRRSSQTISALAIVSASIIACSDASSPKPTLVLAPPSIQLTVCQEGIMSASVSTQTTSVVVFESADPTIATITSAGRVRGVKAGTTRIRAWLADNTALRDSSDAVVTGAPAACPAVQ